MKYLVETAWITDHLDERPASVDLLTILFNEGAGLWIRLITYGEPYERTSYNFRRSEQLEVAFVELLRWIKMLLLDEAIMRRFAVIRESLGRGGQLIGHPGILIAASALERD